MGLDGLLNSILIDAATQSRSTDMYYDYKLICSYFIFPFLDMTIRERAQQSCCSYWLLNTIGWAYPTVGYR